MNSMVDPGYAPALRTTRRKRDCLFPGDSDEPCACGMSFTNSAAGTPLGVPEGTICVIGFCLLCLPAPTSVLPWDWGMSFTNLAAGSPAADAPLDASPC